MITEALQHCRGVGPVRLQQLREAGVRSWYDALEFPERIPEALRSGVVRECQQCVRALEAGELSYFARSLDPQDRWRILAEFHDRATYFDIETTGLEYDSQVTVIACWHQGKLLTFVEHENLDDFLDVLDDTELLVSFNGSTFDVPRLLEAFHIPEIPCAHVDLRWLCYHKGLTGGLKDITATLGLQRPRDLQDVDGDLAIQLWQQWVSHGHRHARELLIRYCAADVLLLQPLTMHLAGQPMSSVSDLWAHLPTVENEVAADGVRERRLDLQQRFGTASPGRLRMLRGRNQAR